MAPSSFEDHFSHASSDYAAYRPVYPDALYDWLAASAPKRERAWDCATGSGQAAVELARRFDRVIASDASADQIAAAQPAPGLFYAVFSAEEPTLDDASVDLITVAQALHWLDHDRFFEQARRVLVPGGLLAACWRPDRGGDVDRGGLSLRVPLPDHHFASLF